MPGTDPVPTEIHLRRETQTLRVRFDNGLEAVLSAEFLRVHSPSAEVTGHSAGEGRLVVGKERVGISRIDPVGRYAVRLVFDDGHDSGLFTWKVLYDLASNKDEKWRRYKARVAASN